MSILCLAQTEPSVKVVINTFIIVVLIGYHLTYKHLEMKMGGIPKL